MLSMPSFHTKQQSIFCTCTNSNSKCFLELNDILAERNSKITERKKSGGGAGEGKNVYADLNMKNVFC